MTYRVQAYIYNPQTMEVASVNFKGLDGRLYLNYPLVNGSDVLTWDQVIHWKKANRNSKLVQAYKAKMSKQTRVTAWNIIK